MQLELRERPTLTPKLELDQDQVLAQVLVQVLVVLHLQPHLQLQTHHHHHHPLAQAQVAHQANSYNASKTNAHNLLLLAMLITLVMPLHNAYNNVHQPILLAKLHAYQPKQILLNKISETVSHQIVSDQQYNYAFQTTVANKLKLA